MPEQEEDEQRLRQLIARSENVRSFLDGMTLYAATLMSRATGAPVQCALILWRPGGPVSIVGSSNDALWQGGLAYVWGNGPALEATETSRAIVIADTSLDQRWPDYTKSPASAHIRNVLIVPLGVGKDVSATLHFFADRTGVFTGHAIRDATGFAESAGPALRLTLRMPTSGGNDEDLYAALARRAPIELASRMIMSRNNCTRAEAGSYLLARSLSSHQKIQTVAESIISAGSQEDKGSTDIGDRHPH
ncbi:GAF and ANTAR domain-containing protein [Arthrobacter sp. SIMBA_036]|uniref:GAF and ANTAR domain-containing protein n=1 Tax=Arthrobacter sp. SIMBA_036 TaxID=3085778 RepID=UPI00397D6023